MNELKLAPERAREALDRIEVLRRRGNVSDAEVQQVAQEFGAQGWVATRLDDVARQLKAAAGTSFEMRSAPGPISLSAPPAPVASGPSPAKVAAAALKLGRQLGDGFYSRVYEGEGPWQGKVAVKTPTGWGVADPRTFDWAVYRDEAQILEALSASPGLPHLLELIEPGKNPEVPHGALVMNLVPGERLAKALERGPIPPERARDLFLDFMKGDLKALHAQGYVHRDLHHLNVQLDPAAGLKLLDVGSALRIDPQTGKTPPSGYGASPPWTAPEEGKGPIDQRADVFAVGSLFFAALTAQGPSDENIRAYPEGPLKDAILKMRAPLAADRPTLDEAVRMLEAISAAELQSTRTLRLYDLYGAESEALNALGDPSHASRAQHRQWAMSVGPEAAMAELKRKLDLLFASNASNRPMLAKYYADFQDRQLRYGISFGSPNRDSAHRPSTVQWAQSAPLPIVRSELDYRLNVFENSGR